MRTGSWSMSVGALATIASLASAVGPAAAGPDWPQFHGPRRDNKSTETGLLKRWPEGGPQLLWTAEGIGEGFSTVAVAGQRVYVTGNLRNGTVITALSLDGTAKWRVRNGPACRHEQPGARGTPTIDGGRLYHENADGDVACLDAETGKRHWTRNILREFRGRNIQWGLSESLLIDGNHVICTPGGEDAGIVALDKATGKTAWVCRETKDKPGYCSPIVFEHGGVRQIATLMARSAVGVDARTGKLLWSFRHVTPFDENIGTCIFHDGRLFFSTRTTGSVLLKVKVEGGRVGVDEVWRCGELDNQHGGVVLLDGHLYGDCLRARGGAWACLQLATGRRTLATALVGRGSLTYADGLFYVMNHRRTVALVRPSPESLEIVSRFELPKVGRGPSWAHPVVCGGRLYLRYSDRLYCHDIRRTRK